VVSGGIERLELLERLERASRLFNPQRLDEVQQMRFVHAENSRRGRAIPMSMRQRSFDDIGPRHIDSMPI
jgi:hypothetical protein